VRWLHVTYGCSGWRAPGSVFVGLLDTRTARSARSSDLHAWSARQAYAITRYCNPSVTHLNRRYWSLIDSMQRRVLTLQTLCDSTKDCWAPLPARLIAVQLPHLTHDYATILFQSGGRLGRSINPGSWSGSAVSFASGVRGIFCAFRVRKSHLVDRDGDVFGYLLQSFLFLADGGSIKQSNLSNSLSVDYAGRWLSPGRLYMVN